MAQFGWLNKMAHGAELALGRDHQKRDWNFLDNHQEQSLKG